MTQSLRTYMNEQGVIFENYRVEPSELEERQDIPKARIALYEDSETTLERNNVVKPSMTLRERIRNDKYVTKTLTLVGKRDMYIDQLVIPPPINTFDLTFDNTFN
jgi:hypothetical protein